MTWTITGTDLPTRVQVQNNSPGAVEVEGGNDQYVTSSGGTPNVVTRKVTVRSPGVFEVKVNIDEQDLIVTTYRRELRRIAAETEAAAERLRAEGRRGQRTIPTADILKVLDDAVADVERSLYFEELAAFRDAVRERADEIRSEVLALSVARADSAAIRLVTLRSADEEETSGEGVPAPSARSALSRFIDYLFGASRVGPLVEICVVTLPVNGATLLLYPKSAPDYTERTTATRFPLYVGLYQWQIKQMTGYLPSSGSVNFLTDPDRIFECRLRSRAGDANACDLVMGKLNQRCRQ